MCAEGRTFTGSKSKLGRAELSTLLHNLAREHKQEMRMHDTLKKRFKTKHSKFDLLTDGSRGSANVRLYQTHTPGFCFRRNGEAKPVLNATISSLVTYEDIYNMLFTGGELDVDKVLCLHLLTAHRTETLTPPVKSQRPVTFLTKEQSPLERLIDRSKKKRKGDNLTKLLPTYVIDVTDEDDEFYKTQPLIRDGRLAQRIIINDKIVQLVHTVLEALRTSNPIRMDELIADANDKNYLQKLAEKPCLQEFWAHLHDQIIIYNCDSFHLSQPFRAKPVSLRLTSSPSLRKLIIHIRQNVLQYPSHNVWGNANDKFQYKEEDVEDPLPMNEVKKGSDRMSKEDVLVIHSLNCLDDEVGSKPRLSTQNSKRTNIDISKTFHSDIENLSHKSINNTMEAERRDSKAISVDYLNETASKYNVSVDDDEGVVRSSKEARKQSALTLDDVNDNNINNISVTQLSKIINHHIKKLTSDDKRTSKLEKKTNSSVTRNKNFAKTGNFVKGSIDGVALNIMDLAKITQEIREKETRKKLSRFLQNSK